MYGVTLLSPAAGEPGETVATHAGELRLTPTDLRGITVAEAATPEDAVRRILTGTITATVGSQSASYAFGPGTVGLSKHDHLPYLVRVSGTTGRVWLEDLAGFAKSDWDYDDRSWRVTVRPLNATSSISGGGTFSIQSYPQTVATAESMWYAAMAEGTPDQIRLQETVTQVSDTEYKWDLVFTNTSWDNGNPDSLYHQGVQTLELAVPDKGDISKHVVPAEWSAIETVTVGGGDLLRWETASDFIMPGTSRTFSFSTPPRPFTWYPGIGFDPADESGYTEVSVEGAGMVPDKGPKVIIADSAGNQVPDDPGLKVAKWQDAFGVDATTGKVVVKGPDGNNHDFIDRDPDRFNVWVYDPMAWNAETERVEVLISTENVAGFTTYNDPATAVDLVRYTGAAKSETGWYWSDSQMLVSSEVDDQYSAEPTYQTLGYLRADDNDPAGFAIPKNSYQWRLSDRTHRIALGGTVKAVYTSAPGEVFTDDAPVKVAKTLLIHTTILKNGGNPVIAKADAEKYLMAANEQYAQVGIRIVPSVEEPVNPPAGVNLVNGLHAFTWPKGVAMMTMTQEEKDLLEAPFRTGAPWTNVIEAYYVNYFADANGVKKPNYPGESFPASGVPNAIYANSIIIASPSGVAFQWPQEVVAHEIGHILLNSGSHLEEPADSVNLMAAPSYAGTDKNNPLSPLLVDDVLASKRLTVEQELIMLGWGQ